MEFIGNKVINRKNPRASANILSALSFAWTFDLFRRGFRRDLNVSDLCEPLPEHTAHLLGNKFEEYWNKELEASKKNPNRKPRLLRVIFKIYGGKVVFYICFTCFSELVFKLGQPLFLSKLLEYFTPNSSMTYTEANLYALGVVVCVGLHLITISPCLLATVHLGMKVRVAMSSLIYRKSLRLSKEASTKIGAGHLVNILSNDASRYDLAFAFLPDTILAPLMVIVASYLIWNKAGLVALYGVVILLLMVPLDGLLAKKIANLRYRVAEKTDYRIRLMSDIVAGIQVIKMYAWEKSFAKIVALARRREIAVIRKKHFIVGALNTIHSFSTNLALFTSLLAYALYGNAITANVVYVMAMCYTIVEKNLTYFPLGIAYAAEALVSVRRMEKILLSEEAAQAINLDPETKPGSGIIELKDVCAKWSSENADDTLENINLRIRPGSLIAIIGTVGSGKSSFLQLILRELPIRSGFMEVGGSVSYASQETWLFGATVRQNIIFDLPMDTHKYKKVVKVCALETDFEQLPEGDQTFVGDRGVCLSGGQRARINLARAVYRDADIYLLDDPLSAVDSHVSKHIFEECICGYLSEKTVVLATHHVQRLTDVGHVIQMDGGKIAAQGSFNELREIGLDMTSLEGSAPSQVKDQKGLTEQASVEDAISVDDLPEDTEIRSRGKVHASVYLAYLKEVKNAPLVVFVIAAYILVIVTSSGSDYWLSFWVNNEEHVFPNNENINVPLFGELNRNVCIYVYSIIIGALVIFSILRTTLFIFTCMRSSTNLHNNMFNSISQATMNFFNNTPSGQILNRFSRDTGTIDEELPDTLSDCVRAGLQVMGSFVIIFIVNYYLMLPFAVVMVALYILRQYYVRTSRSVKRVESIARSPIYTHLNASLQGLTTIRAMRAQSRLHQEFDQKLDIHSSAWYYILGTNRAFSYCVDLTCCLYVTLVTFSFLIWKDQYLGGDVGLAITQSMGLIFLFQWFVRQSAEVENKMTSVERVCEFGKVESESQHLVIATDQKLHGWPARGEIHFSEVYLRYDPGDPPVLKNINFNIHPGEKIGVVGRTGAGKSSLVASLFRLQKVEGKISIDGIETGSIGLHDLRSRISIIPQEPVIFSGTMRLNLDPFEQYKDSRLWSVLEEVELKSLVKDNPGGLLTNLAEGGVNLSVGQRQLVCLARAILRNSTVLVLDEATANVDAETDDFIQAAIRKRFAHCTVITIAHRLHTIMDSDRIIVMDNGVVVEFGPPQELLQNPKGHFTHLVGLAGPRPSGTTYQQTKSERKSTDEKL